MKRFEILKGNHFSFPIHINLTLKKTIEHKVYFDESANYDFKDLDQLDINKLFGISSGFHHKNSARFGWRWDVNKNKIEILAYVYRDGVRINEWDEKTSICFVDPLDILQMKISMENGDYNFSILNETNQEDFNLSMKHGKECFIGYKLYPYFGGNRTAPQDIMIFFIG